jgi:hypothetical protein
MKVEETVWHYAKDGAVKGPISGNLLTDSEVQPGTLVWIQGMPEWKIAAETPLGDMLFGTPPELPPPLPSPIAPPPRPMVAIAPEPPTKVPVSPKEIKAEKKGNYLSRHWRGELSLGRTYWMNCFGLAMAMGAITTLLLELLPESMDLRLSAILALSGFLGAITVHVWQIVGLYRATCTCSRDGGRLSVAIWGWIALALMGIGSGTAVVTQIVPQAIECTSILNGDKGIPAMQLVLLPSGTEVEISGGLPAGCADEFREFLAKTPRIMVLHIDSIGGRVQEAMAIAKIVENRGMTTFVAQKCMSAATLIFVAGKERYALAGAKIGFHGPSFPGLDKATLAITNERVRKYLKNAGVKAEFISNAESVPPEKMWFPKTDELIAAGVLTAETHGERFSFSSSILKNVESPELDDRLLAISSMQALRDVDSRGYEELKREFVRTFTSGKSQMEAFAITRGLLSRKFLEAIPYAHDAEVDALIDYWLYFIDLYEADRPEVALAYLVGSESFDKKFFGAGIPENFPNSQEQVVLAKIIKSGGRHLSIEIRSKQAEQDLASVMTQMNEISPAMTKLFRSPEKYEGNVPGALAAYKLYFSTIKSALNLPHRANLLRWLLTADNQEGATSVQPRVEAQPKANVRQVLSLDEILMTYRDAKKNYPDSKVTVREFCKYMQSHQEKDDYSEGFDYEP